MTKLKYAVLMLALFVPVALLAQGGGPGGPGGGEPGGRRVPSVDEQLDHLSQKLNLTDAQKPQIKTILQDQRDRMKQVMDSSTGPREENRSKMREIHEAAADKIRAVLTDEQKAKFDKMQDQHRKHTEEGHGDQGTPPPPPQE
jgi:Spy/CpxP family protein refolding chaperone